MELNIPAGYDAKTVKDWVYKSEVLAQSDNDGNYTVLVRDKSKCRRFLRFFLGGGKTQVSVDYDENFSSNDEKLFELLNERFG